MKLESKIDKHPALYGEWIWILMYSKDEFHDNFCDNWLEENDRLMERFRHK